MLEGHDFLLQVDKAFLQDKFNLICLDELMLSKERIRECMKLLLKKHPPSEEELQNTTFLQLNQDTSDLYGLIHARYIRSPEGKLFL